MGIRVLLADDHTMFRRAVRQILQSRPGIEVVGEAGDGEQVCEMVAELQPDVVVMDIHMPHMDGIRATQDIMQKAHPPAVIILTMSKQDSYISEAIRAGARGYYLKDAEPSEFLEAIEKASKGEMVLGAAVAEHMLSEFRQTVAPSPAGEAIASLDDRKIDILRRVASGSSNQEIGRALSLSEKTIKNQLSEIFRKLHLANRTQAAIYALRHGLIQLEEMEV